MNGKRAGLISCLILFVLPALMLFESLVLGDDFVPFDHRYFAPTSAALDGEELQQLRDRANWQITEKTMLVAPEFELAKQELAEGRLPHYNPWVRSGAPLFANVLDGFAYPLHLPFFFGRLEGQFALVALLAFALAGFFMLGFLREIGLSWQSALFGAIAFQLSGTLTANAHFYMRMETLAWLPAGFWALECHIRRPGIRSALAFAFAVAMTWLAGFPPYALVCSLAFGARILCTVFTNGWRTTLWLSASAVLGLGLAALQLLPMVDYFPEAQRNLNQGLDELANQGIDPLALFGLAMPFPFGTPIGEAIVPADRHPLLYSLWSRTSPTSGKLFFPVNYNYIEYAIYLGVLPCVCLLFSAVVAPFQRARFRVFATVLFVGAFVFAMGGVVFQSLAVLPVIKSTPPSRFVGLLCFFGAALAGIGFESLTVRVGVFARRAATLCCSVGAAVALGYAMWSRGLADDSVRAVDHALDTIAAHWQSSYPEVAGDREKLTDWFGDHAQASYRMFSNSLMGLAATLFAITVWLVSLPYPGDTQRSRRRNLLIHGAILATAVLLLLDARYINPSFPPPPADEKPNSVLTFLREKRIEHAKDGGFTIARVAKVPDIPIPLPPNLLIPERIRDLNSYAFVDRRSHLPFVSLYGPEQMIRQYWLKSLPIDERLRLGLFDLLGVRYLVSATAIEPLGKPTHEHDRGGHGQTFVYERDSVLPRAFLVAKATVAQDDDSMTKRLISAEFDPRKELWLHEVEAGVTTKAEASTEDLAKASVRFVEDETTSLSIEIKASPGAWLVLSDAVYSHWHATVGGEAADWHRANLFCRALWIPPGDTVVEFDYDAAPFRYGTLVSGASIAIVLLALVLSFRRRRRPDVVPSPADPSTSPTDPSTDVPDEA